MKDKDEGKDKDEFRVMNYENGLRRIVNLASPANFILHPSSFILVGLLLLNSSFIISR